MGNKLYKLSAIALLSAAVGRTQCVVQSFPKDTVELICGDSISGMYASGNTGNFLLNNNFNNGNAGSGWLATSAATYTNPCGPGLDGTTHLWMGDATPQPRALTTLPFDLTLGGNICFELKYSTQGEAQPCEGPDLPEEGVYLQYSINGGANWVTIQYFDPLGGYDPELTQWKDYCFSLPPAAQTASTQIRWFQDATSGAEYDHWGLDNISIALNDPSYQFIWTHNGFVGQYPPTVFPTTDTTYTVLYTNGTDTCSSTVYVKLVPPILEVTTLADTVLCGKGCLDLISEAKIIASPEQTKTFENNEAQPLAPFGVPTVFPINVAGLNTDIVQASSILAVCMTVSTSGFGPFVNTLADISARLISPQGTAVQLFNTGDAAGSVMTSACFTSSATTFLSTGTSPYTGVHKPAAGNFNLFNGDSVNGVWTLELSNVAFSPFGTFSSWNITIKDPEISYDAIFSWTPTTWMNDSTILNPTVCPEADITYKIKIRDPFNCGIASDSVKVSLPSVGGLSATTTVVGLSQVGATDGTITLTASGGNPPYQFSNDSGATFVDNNVFENLPAGEYTFYVKDVTGCEIQVKATIEEVPEINIPNVISPNNVDDLNDFFVIQGMRTPHVIIYNRWGNKVYENETYQNDWNGEKHKEGVYFYVIKNKADNKAYTGTLHIF